MRKLDPENVPAPECGAYILVLRQAHEQVDVRVGALGTVAFRRGFYCYVGRARKGLPARLARHLRRSGKRLRWHVDYLREAAQPVGVLIRAGGEADECALSRAVGGLARRSVPGFGCSDCRCGSHLHYFRADPTRRLRASLGADLVEVRPGSTGT